MVNDEDPDDWSGIEIARDTAPDVPKIVLTAYPGVRAVREALSPALRDVPPAVAFLSKKQGLPSVLEAIRVALDPGIAASRMRLLAAMESPNVLALSEATERLGVDDSMERIRSLLEVERADLSVSREAAERRASQQSLYVNIAAWIAVGLIVVALVLLARGEMAGTTASLAATLAVSAVKRLFEGRAREAQKAAQDGLRRVVRLNWVHQMIEIAGQLDGPRRGNGLERILDFMLSDGKDL
jgi:hypothetical protein